MKMRHMLGTAVLGMGVALPLAAFADREDRAENVVNALNLDGERSQEVQETIERYHDQKSDVKERAKDEMSSIEDQKESRLQAILTDDEYEQYESMKDAKKERKDKKDKR